MEIYLDNSATTKCSESVIELMARVMGEDYGNPSSLHKKGVEAEAYIRRAKEQLAGLLKAKEKELIFTSGGTESDNLAIIGAALAAKRAGNHLITTQIEHPAVLETMKHLENEGYQVTYLPVDREGTVDLDAYKKAIRQDTILISCMMVNNEVGSVQPIGEMVKIKNAINPSCLFHTDAVQAFGKLAVCPRQMGVDLLSVSGHKIHGPKGIGFLYVKDGTRLHNIVYGGGQQKNLRSGTENVPGIAGIAQAAVECYNDFDEKQKALYERKQYFIGRIGQIEGAAVNGQPWNLGAPHIVSVSFDGVRSEVLLHGLEEHGIYVSSGSACASNKPSVSNTLKAMGIQQAHLDATIRFSFSFATTRQELDCCIDTLQSLLPMLRRFSRR